MTPPKESLPKDIQKLTVFLQAAGTKKIKGTDGSKAKPKTKVVKK